MNILYYFFLFFLFCSPVFAELTDEEQSLVDEFMVQIENSFIDPDLIHLNKIRLKRIRADLAEKKLTLGPKALLNRETETVLNFIPLLTFLEELDLSGNNFKLLPAELRNVVNLKKLILDETLEDSGDTLNWGRAELLEAFGKAVAFMSPEEDVQYRRTFRTTASYANIFSGR